MKGELRGALTPRLLPARAVCKSAGRQVVINAAGQASVNQVAPAPAPPHKSNVTGTTPFFFDFAKLSDGDIELVTVITAATCIRYQLLGARARAGLYRQHSCHARGSAAYLACIPSTCFCCMPYEACWGHVRAAKPVSCTGSLLGQALPPVAAL